MSFVTFDFVCTKNTDYKSLHQWVDSYISNYKDKHRSDPNLNKEFKIIIK